MSSGKRDFSRVPSTSEIVKNAIAGKANVQYKSKKLWRELSLPTSEYDLNRPNIFSLPEKLLRHSPKMMAVNGVKKKKCKVNKTSKSYTQIRHERDEFRKKLVELVLKSEEEIKNDPEFSITPESEIMRYYYYIKHGVDTVHVSPIEKRLLNRISKLIPKRFAKWKNIIDSITVEFKTEYNTAIKKSVIDFVLGESLVSRSNLQEDSVNREELKEMLGKWRYRYEENRMKIKRTLFAINPCLSQILAIWYTTYKGLSYVDMEKVRAKGQPYDLSEFTKTIVRQIEDAKTILSEKWYGDIQAIIQKGSKKKLVPETTKPKLLLRFYNSVAALMTQQIQEMCIKGLKAYTDYVCGKNTGFKLTILLESEGKLSFSPPFVKFRAEFIRMIDLILKVGYALPRIETKIYLDTQSSGDNFLKPAIPNDFIEECHRRINSLINEQKIGPETRVHDFDDYMDLMNGKNVDEVEKFIIGNPKFEEYCELIEHYKNIEHEIASKVSGMINMGFFEFHREGLIDTLETLARFLQNELIKKITAEQQASMFKLTGEYEDIVGKLLASPRDTKALMELKEFSKKVEEKVVTKMEDELRVNLQQLLYLTDYTILTPLEIKLNTTAFHWYLKMPSVIDDNRKLIDEKMIEYQDHLKRRIELFKRDLEIYWEQLEEYVEWGDIKNLGKYYKKAAILDKK